MELNGIVLDDAAVKTMRDKYVLSRRRRGGCKLNLPFEKLLETCVTERDPQKTIALATGVTKQAVSHTVQLYIAPLLPDSHKTGFQRKSAYAQSERKAAAKRLPPRGLLKRVALEAEKHYLSVERVLCSDGFRARRLMIGGHACGVVVCLTTYKPSNHLRNPYIRITTSESTLDEVRFVIVVAKVPGFKVRYFVIPAKLIKEKYSASERGRVSLIGPLTIKNRVSTHRWYIDLSEFKGVRGWRLLKSTSP